VDVGSGLEEGIIANPSWSECLLSMAVCLSKCLSG
jgi:hypothetical protein